ncbi:TetR/AcrR family transcriptional regulator [Acidovorax sp. HDW3]|uniref:TetR/AcrR family transcriptional regulator n=1 Tax=Acidovorax sp. HDW3 TaxID=2714923 RepID=UPI001407F43B|nr:TetR/AcrR family transcriptional regulator [Acidovorax sp. HDW3]QIL43252.1 TetR/AcrR family transcriptional regulator [Acidovorax sp. HDW3]
MARPPTPPPNRRTLEAQSRRRDMLSAARKLLRKGGADAVTMRAVAEQVGVSTTVVYALFPDKAALIAQAVDDDLKRFSRHLQQALAAAQSPSDALRRVAQAYATFGVSHPQAYRLMFMQLRPTSAVADSSIEFGNPSEDAYALARLLATQLLQVPNGPVVPQSAIDCAAQLLWEALHGVTALRITSGDDPWFERLPLAQHVDRMVDMLLAGLPTAQAHPAEPGLTL